MISVLLKLLYLIRIVFFVFVIVGLIDYPMITIILCLVYILGSYILLMLCITI